jgi:hypothetical protein
VSAARGSYLTEMARKTWLILLVVLTCAVPAVMVGAQSDEDGRYTIMRPEPGSREALRHKAPKEEEPPPPETTKRTPKHKTVRGSSNPVYPTPLPPPLSYMPPLSQQVMPPHAAAPPAVVMPQTGQVLPNFPSTPGAGPGGAETFQDRSVRCAHQAGAYGSAVGDRNAYIGTCINQ